MGKKLMKRVLLLLCKGVEVYEAAALYDVLGWATEYGEEKIEVVTVGLQNEVRATFGLRLVPDRLLSAVRPEDFDALAVPGGFETHGYYEEAYSEPVADLIRRFDALGKAVASVCVGALPVGNSGVLKGRQATTYGLRGGVRREQLARFGVEVQDKAIVKDRNILTSSGPATAMEVAFELLTTLTGKANADQIRRMMGFPA